MNPIVSALIGLVSAVIVAVIAQAGQYMRDRKNHDEVKTDKSEEREDEVLIAIKNISGQISEMDKRIDNIDQRFERQNQRLEDIDGRIVLQQEELSRQAKRQEENFVKQSRIRILRFDDELSGSIDHSKEHFMQIMEDIDIYEDYCDSHPDFHNGIATSAMKHIRKVYDELKEKCTL